MQGWEGKVVLVIVPRLLTRLMKNDEMPFGKEIWGDSSMVIPTEIAGNKFRNILTGETIGVGRTGWKGSVSAR